ncbi:hypothetical protein SAMN04487981_105348 [Streptomyces sp. cf386]|uniref:hypothetical protein n=1 Tax=Streptomyces sp. cf386 TaxID=1761904 RepID=UPI000890F19B|nr:hypothetical protein [Streptomyces sp. cf386]SDN53017.1 hypothetical protein SAMN04487981_105348 [Streptomyces sp. cf386]
MRIRTALAAAALGTLVVLGGATAAHADVDDQTTTGAAFGNESWQGPSFDKGQSGAAFGDEAWAGPSFGDQAGGASGSEATRDMGQAQGFGDADSSFQQ